MNSAGIYIHIPFCQHICNYCDYFTTEKKAGNIPHFVQMLLREIELTAGNFAHHDWQIDSIYLGGGSPALLFSSKIITVITDMLAEWDMDIYTSRIHVFSRCI